MQNTDLKELKRELKEAIGNNRLEECFRRLQQVIQQDQEVENQLIQLMGRMAALNRDITSGSKGDAANNQEMNSIRNALLTFISQLSEEDILLARPINRIMVICRKGQKKADAPLMARFFPESMAEFSVQYDDSGDIPDLNKIDLILFDNHLMRNPNDPSLSSEEQAHLELLKRLINETLPYIVYYGRIYQGLKDDDWFRVNAANFPITLLPRIRETLDFAQRFS
jgi:Effector-associated domain 11